MLGEEWWVWHNTEDTTQGDFKRIESIYTGTYFGEERIFKEIYKYYRVIIDSEYIDILDSREILASGLGVVLKYINDSWVRPPEYLVSAIISGDTLGIIVGIEDPLFEEPNHDFRLSQNYPNPFNPATIISYEVTNESIVQLKIYDILGREVAELVNETKLPGTYQVNFDANDLSSGVYIYRIVASRDEKILFTNTMQMTLIK